VTEVLTVPAARRLAKSREPRAKAAWFQVLAKAPSAISFVLDFGGSSSNSANNPPIEGRIPDAI
jgi:hypothetical protein